MLCSLCIPVTSYYKLAVFCFLFDIFSSCLGSLLLLSNVLPLIRYGSPFLAHLKSVHISINIPKSFRFDNDEKSEAFPWKTPKCI